MIDKHRRVQACHRFALPIPGQRKTRAMTRIASVFGSKSQRCESCFAAKDIRRNLVGRNTIVKTLPRFRVSIRTGEIKSASPVSFVIELVGQVLNDRHVIFVAGERLQPDW